MAHSSYAGISEFRFADKSQLGYSCAEVDEYFSRLAEDFEHLRQGEKHESTIESVDIRLHSFSSEEGGYLPEDVDRALDRVEDRFADFERGIQARTLGRQGWEEKIEADAALIMGRLDREAGQRFRRPSHQLTKGYYVREVDALCDRLADYFRSDQPLDPTMIRQAAFQSATGDMCYEETQVDAFLDRCIALILDLKVS